MDEFIHGRHRGRGTKWSEARQQQESWQCTFGLLSSCASGHMQMKKISILKLTRQQHESWQRMSCTLPQACAFLLVCPCLCPYLNQNCSWMLHKRKKIMLEEGEKWLKSNSISQSFLDERLWCFSRFRVEYRQSNHNIVVQINRCPVSEK